MVLVDTSIRSLAYRRRPDLLSAGERRLVEALRVLAEEDQATLIGPVRFEVLSGIRQRQRFEWVRGFLSSFRTLPLEISTYDSAAEFDNRCRSAGVTPGAIDMLIAAGAVEHGQPVFTTDRDFEQYAKLLPMKLFKPAGRAGGR